MSLELLFLSTKLLFTLLLASMLAFVIGWLIRGKKHVPTAAPVTLAEVDPREQQIVQLRQQQQELEQQCRHALELRDAAESEATKQRRQRREMEDQLTEQQADLTTAQEQIHHLEKLQREHATQQQEQQGTLQHQLSELTTRVQTAEATAATARAQYTELESTLAGLKMEAQQQKSLAQSAEQKNQQAQQAKTQAEHQQRELATQLSQAHEQVKHWQAVSQQKKQELEAQQQVVHTSARAASAKPPPFKKFMLVCKADESPLQAAKAAHVQAQQQLYTLEAVYQERLHSVNALDAQTPLPKVELATARTLLRETQKHLADARTLAERTARIHAALERTFSTLPDSEPDDLTKIKGIKTVLSSKLNEFGIYTYQQIVQLSPADRLAYGDLLGFGNRIDRDDWVEQAKRLVVVAYTTSIEEQAHSRSR